MRQPRPIQEQIHLLLNTVCLPLLSERPHYKRERKVSNLQRSSVIHFNVQLVADNPSFLRVHHQSSDYCKESPGSLGAPAVLTCVYTESLLILGRMICESGCHDNEAKNTQTLPVRQHTVSTKERFWPQTSGGLQAWRGRGGWISHSN